MLGEELIDQLVGVIVVLVLISLAAERIVEIAKGIFPSLGVKSDVATEEGKRTAKILALAVVCGIAITFVTQSYLVLFIPEDWAEKSLWWLVLGVLSAGGSSFLNSILGAVKKLKPVK